MERIDFVSGSSISILSAESGYPPGEGLLGHNGTIIVVDESGSIKDETYKTKILRMLGAEGKRRILIEIGTPHRANHFYDSYLSSDYHKIVVDYKIAIKEKRLSKRFIELQRKTLSKIEFDMWYGAKFPEDTEDKLIRRKWIERALKNNFRFRNKEAIYIGVDVARFGTDKTVIMIVSKKGERFKLIGCKYYSHKPLTETAGRVINIAKKYNPNKIYIDDTGIGGSITDSLMESEFKNNIIPIVAGSTTQLTEEEKKRFNDISSRNAVKLANLFERGLIDIYEVGDLIPQLNQPIFTFTSAGKTKIDKNPEDKKSPDFFDALSLATCELSRKKTEIMWI